MDKIKEIVNDPARLEVELKKFFEKVDAEDTLLMNNISKP